MRQHDKRWLAAGALAAFLAFAGTPVHADTAVVVPPLTLPGPYPVACSNVAQDFTRVASDENAEDYWDGRPRANGTSRYVTDLLSDPANTLTFTVNAPSDSDLYGSFAGRAVAYVVLACYPTTADNARPDYALPTGEWVPHMQRGDDAPLLPDATTRFPLLLFSHGLNGSPLSGDDIHALAVLASFGYIVAAPFHGDPRFLDLSVDNLGDVGYVLFNLRDFLALQALRPLSLSATIDLLLARPQWRDHIDASKIGAFGASMGGESTLLMAGAGLTSSLGLSWSTVTKDVRLRAAVGYVPYFGQPLLPAFGRDQHGLDDVVLPYLAISGTADTTAPIVATLQGMNRLAGPRELVALVGVTHGFDVASTNDIFTWTLTFLDAEVRGDPAALRKLLGMASVAGGGDDYVVVPYNGAAALNYGGLWWNAPAESESGWGINFAHQGDVIFATWFTYDTTGKAWWLAMQANRTATGVYAGTIFATHGPAFNAVPFDPSKVTETTVGSGTLSFTDANDASVRLHGERGDPDQDADARGVRRVGAGVHVRRNAAGGAGDELPGPVVGLPRRQRVGVGGEPDPPGRRDLRDLVHLRRERESAVAVGTGDEDRAGGVHGDAGADDGTGVQRGAVRPDAGHRDTGGTRTR